MTIIGITLAACYLLFGVGLFEFQKNLIYFPTHAYHGLGEEQVYAVPGAKINVLNVNPHCDSLIIYFGGNGEQIELNASYYAQHFPHFTSALVNYRGFGGSSGKPNKVEIQNDVLAIYDSIAPHYQKVVLIGRSLGTGVAMWLASQRHVDRLVLITPYESMASVAQDRFPIYPISWILKENWNSLALAPKIHIPILLLVAEKDDVIPSQHAYTLARALDGKIAQVKTVSFANHNTIQYYEPFRTSLDEFVNAGQ